MTDTATQTDTLYMLQLWLDARRLSELARALHLPLHSADDGYLAHCALGEMFGDRAPGPFCIEGHRGRHLRLLAYGADPHGALEEVARSAASPLAYQIGDWERAASKPMPEAFAEGAVLDFHLRACPVVRKSSAGKHHEAGAEVDAFLSAVWEVDDPSVPVEREDVYRGWLEQRLGEKRGAHLLPETVRLERFSLERMLRRTGGDARRTKVIKRPAATFSGRLHVTDGAQFHVLLRRGIGRHTGFGFGMLKVRPPRGR
jgi:CRISPR system Cascade subunit CasE